MKPKYAKPTLTSFPLVDVKAEGFEILGACFPGTSVGPYPGECEAGASAGYFDCWNGGAATVLNACATGSGDVKESIYCFAGGTR